jgi:hypothetical protein
MRAAIFVGPTLSADPILQRGGSCQWLPPAANGDVYRVAQTRPDVIGIIDGTFETGPSVWHKEILWALSKGIHVYGAASMGALRAAELDAFGMIGIGSIYRDFRTGVLTDDDEVAVLHAPKELGWQPLTEALVDMRATIVSARDARILSAKSASSLLRTAKATFFKERTWEHVLDAARLPKVERARFRCWLPSNRVELKRRDARALFRAVSRHLANRTCRHCPSFTFSHTVYWQSLMDAQRDQSQVHAKPPRIK